MKQTGSHKSDFPLKKMAEKSGIILIHFKISGCFMDVSACSKVFYRAGCKVILSGRNLQQLTEVQTELLESEQKVGYRTVNFSLVLNV